MIKRGGGNLAYRALALLGVTVLVASGAAAGASPCGSWEMVTPVLHGRDLADVAFGGGRFVAVGYSVSQWSKDGGETWHVSVHPGVHLNGVASDGISFVAVGDGGVVLRSSDGAAWERVTVPSAVDFHGVAYGHDRFVLAGTGATILTSSSGLDWSAVAAPTTDSLDGVAFSGGRFLVYGAQGTLLEGDGASFARIDVEVWWPGPVTTAAALGDRIWAVMEGMGYERVGGVWTRCSVSGCAIPAGTRRLVAGGGMLYALGSSFGPGPRGTILASSDARTWSEPVSLGVTAFEALAIGDGAKVAVGRAGLVAARRADGDWHLTAGAPRELLDVATDGEVFVAVTADAGCGALASENGLEWTCRATSLVGSRVVWSGDRFVALAGRYPSMAPSYTSADGRSWTPVPQSPAVPVTDVVSFRGQTLGLGGYGGPCPFECSAFPATVLASSDLHEWRVAWQDDPTTVGLMTSGATNGQRLVAVRCASHGDGSWACGLLVSDDGAQWRPVATPVPLAQTTTVRFAGTHFVAAGGGWVLTSLDGLVWSVTSKQSVEAWSLAWSGTELFSAGMWGPFPYVGTEVGGRRWSIHYPFVQPRPCSTAGALMWNRCPTIAGLAAMPQVQLAVGEGGILLRRECPFGQAGTRRRLYP